MSVGAEYQEPATLRVVSDSGVALAAPVGLGGLGNLAPNVGFERKQARVQRSALVCRP